MSRDPQAAARLRWRAARAALALGALLAVGAPPAAALDKVRLQLKWTHSFQFAGYYAAAARGDYRDAGLEVELLEGEPGLDVVQAVANGDAEFGIGGSGLLLERAHGVPVVVLATIFQHSPLVLIARADDPIQSIHDMAGKTVMIEPHSEALIAYLRQEGIPENLLNRVEHSFSEGALLDGSIDAMSAYTSHEPFFLDRAGFAYQIYSPRSAGIDFYGDLLFTSTAILDRHPERVRAFVEASLRGWDYALAHPEETIALIREHFAPELDPDFLRFQVEQMARLIRADLIEVGYINPGRWRHIAEVYADLGMMDRDLDLSGFLYAQRNERDLTRLYWTLFAVVALAALLFALNVFFARLNRRTRESLEIATQARAAQAESEGRLRTLMRLASAGILMAQGRRLVFVNQAMSRLTGYSETELLEMRALEFVAPKHREMVGRRAESRQRGGDEPERYEIEIETKAGETRWIDLTAARTSYRGHSVSIATLHDVTERRQAEQALREREQQYRLITETMQDVIWVMDAESGRLRYVSPSVRQLRGFDADYYATTTFEDWLAPESRARLRSLHPQRLRAFLSGEADPEATYRDEVEHTRSDGSTVWCEIIARFRRNPSSGRAELYGVTRDISKRKDVEEQLRRANQELKELATTDPLTGLPNRRLFYEIAERALATAGRNRAEAAVMSLDLDRFKPINDSFGHQVGDQALIETARRLNQALRRSDTAARLGGDEFLILLPQIKQNEDLLKVAEKIRALFAEPLRLDGREISLSISIGGATYPKHGTDVDSLIKASDQALYRSKEHRDGSFSLYQEPPASAANSSIALGETSD